LLFVDASRHDPRRDGKVLTDAAIAAAKVRWRRGRTCYLIWWSGAVARPPETVLSIVWWVRDGAAAHLDDLARMQRLAVVLARSTPLDPILGMLPCREGSKPRTIGLNDCD